MDDLTPAMWRKSTRSQGYTNCVEVANLPHGGRAVRDSKSPAGAMLRFTAAEWAAFTAGLRAGQLD